MCVLEEKDKNTKYISKVSLFLVTIIFFHSHMMMLLWCGGMYDSAVNSLPQGRLSLSLQMSYPEDEADGGHSRCGHDFGTVGHKVQQCGHDALCSVVKLVTQH